MTDDNDSIFENLTRRRVLGGIVTVGAAGAAAGAGTAAYFSDSVGSTSNQIQSGNIDLTTNGDNSADATIQVSNLAPGETKTQSLTLRNEGSIDGFVNLDFGTSNQNDLTEVLETTVRWANTNTVIRKGTFDSVFDGEGEYSNADFPLSSSSGVTRNLEIEVTLPTGATEGANASATADYTINLNQQEEAFADVVVPDDTSSIQDAVDAVPAGGVVLVRRTSIYNQTVDVSTNDVKLASKNSPGSGPARIKPDIGAGDDNRAIEVEAGTTGVTVSGFDISFVNNPTPGNGEKYAVRAKKNADNLTVRNCNIHDIKESDGSGFDGAVRAVGVTVNAADGTPMQGPDIENNVIKNLRCPGAVKNDNIKDDDSRAKAVALNNDIRGSAIVCNEFKNIGTAASDESGAEFSRPGNFSSNNDGDDSTTAAGTHKVRGISMTEDSSSEGPKRFTILENTFEGFEATFGQVSIFIGGTNGFGPDHDVLNNTFRHPVDNLSSEQLVLRQNTYDNSSAGVPQLVTAETDADGGNLIERPSAGGYDFDQA